MDYKYSLNFDKFCKKILRNVSKDNKQFVQSQFDKLYDDFMIYLLLFLLTHLIRGATEWII